MKIFKEREVQSCKNTSAVTAIQTGVVVCFLLALEMRLVENRENHRIKPFTLRLPHTCTQMGVGHVHSSY
jgi:hypothetical protein